MKIDVLDHGFVRLVSYTQPVPEERFYDTAEGTDQVFCQPDDWTGDLEISRNARVSYDAPARPEDTKLINYLYKNRHTSPFECMVFTFEVKAPIFVFRQWHRHRTWSYNEVSARYTELPKEVYTPELGQITEQHTDNKQMRTTEQHQMAPRFQFRIRKQAELAFSAYQKMLREGCPRELARAVLPVGTYSHMFATVDLHNLFHFLRLRMHEHSQYEIRVYAEALLQLISPIVPDAVQAFKDN